MIIGIATAILGGILAGVIGTLSVIGLSRYLMEAHDSLRIMQSQIEESRQLLVKINKDVVKAHESMANAFNSYLKGIESVEEMVKDIKAAVIPTKAESKPEEITPLDNRSI